MAAELNAQQYHQAHHTLFGSGPLADTIGRAGDKPASKALLAGEPPVQLYPTLMPETVSILETIGKPYPYLQNSTSIITDNDFITTYKIVKESTSLSP